MTRKIDSNGFISGLTELDRKLDQDPTEWVLPSKKELFEYRKQILNDPGLGHSLLELSDLIINQKYIWPIAVEFESTLNDKHEMHNALVKYQSILSKKRLQQICKGSSQFHSDLRLVQKFDFNSFMNQNANFRRKHPLLFLRGNGRQPSLDYSLISLLHDLPEQQKEFCFSILLNRAYHLDRKIRYTEAYGYEIPNKFSKPIRSVFSYRLVKRAKIAQSIHSSSHSLDSSSATLQESTQYKLLNPKVTHELYHKSTFGLSGNFTLMLAVLAAEKINPYDLSQLNEPLSLFSAFQLYQLNL